MTHSSFVKIMIFFAITAVFYAYSLTLYAKPSFMAGLKGEKVAVVVYAQNHLADAFKKNALSHLENIFADNDITVLDKDKADELKDVFNTLDDPGTFVTAEMFVENAGKYEIKGLAAIYLSVDVAAGIE